MKSRLHRRLAEAISILLLVLPVYAPAQLPSKQLNMQPLHISTDPSVRYDYDIVYVRAPIWIELQGKKRQAVWAEFSNPFAVNPGSDLMLLRPDGTEELLVSGGEGAIQDPYVSFDGEWVFYTKFHLATGSINLSGSDIYKVHVKSRKIVQLTRQEFAANKEGIKFPYGVYNMHPCPVPGGRVAFVSNRNGLLPPPKSYPQVALQLHIIDEDGSNIETIGDLNRAGALHPVILKDGRIIFSSLENMGLRNYILWGIWSIYPDGTHWAPVVSALQMPKVPSSWHFQTQLTDGSIVNEIYYNQNQRGFGSLFKMPEGPPQGTPAFGPGDNKDPRNPGWKFLASKGAQFRTPFTPYGMALLTPWIDIQDFPSLSSVPDDPKAPRIGKVTHPSGAPDNHLLLVWSPGPIGGSSGAVQEWMTPQPLDAGLYLVKNSQITEAPGDMLLIKNDPRYNEQWPRPLVSYKRLYGVDAPQQLVHKNDGKAYKVLPEGTPFGLVGTSSLYKRESAPLGKVPPGGVTAVLSGYEKDKLATFFGTQWNWHGQGADAGRYDNSAIHAIRILVFEPNTYTPYKDKTGYPPHKGYPLYKNHPMERLRILGEIPVRHFENGKQRLDPDGNPDTSFLAKIPADTVFTFQTIDEKGMVLNMAQTWHQIRPGESRYDCGGCHAHSQPPTPFGKTSAARPDYVPFDLTTQTPLVTSQAQDASGKQWDTARVTGLHFAQAPYEVEYWRDIRPIFERSCTACHTKQWPKPAGGLILDDDETTIQGLPGTYFRLAADDKAQFSPKRLDERLNGADKTRQFIVRALLHSDMSSHYIWKFQSRRSPLIWKIYGDRLDGWTNEDIPGGELAPNDPRRQQLLIPNKAELLPEQRLYIGDIDYTGEVMPPPTAVQGTYHGPDGKPIKVAPLTDEDRRKIVRWIDLGCLIDLTLHSRSNIPKTTASTGLSDEQRPTLTLTYPEPGSNPPLSRILVGMHDYDAGLDINSFQVTADFAVDGIPAGRNLAPQFHALPDYRWELRLTSPITDLARGKLVVSIKDRQDNISRIERIFSVSSKRSAETR